MALFLLLAGPPGTGKTVAATHCVVDFCRNWAWNSQPSGPTFEPVLYVDASSLTRLSAFDSNDKAYLEQLQNARLLVLEDAGDEGTELGKGVFVELLMTRHAKRKRTVVCSNVTLPAFKARYGEAVADRIRSAGIVPELSKIKSMRGRL
jgi:DNA replication protein DnaC